MSILAILGGSVLFLIQKCEFEAHNWDRRTSTIITQFNKKFSKNNKLSTFHLCLKCTTFIQVQRTQLIFPKMKVVEKKKS